MRNLMMVGVLLFAWSGCSDDDTTTDAAVTADMAVDSAVDTVVEEDAEAVTRSCGEIVTCSQGCSTAECPAACIASACDGDNSTAAGTLLTCVTISCFATVTDGGTTEADAGAEDSGADDDAPSGQLCNLEPTSAACQACIADECGEAMTACQEQTCP